MQKTLFGAWREHHQNWYTLSLLYQSETSKKIYGSSIPISDNNYKSTHVILFEVIMNTRIVNDIDGEY